MADSLRNKTAVVTGAAQGIGKSIARRLGDDGASIVIADIQTDVAKEAARKLKRDGISAEAVSCDVTDEQDADLLVSETIERFGSLDILVNNAGIGDRKSFTDLDTSSWQEVTDINLMGAFNCSRAAVPAMIEQGEGSVVNISSMAGRNISYHGAANYTASKWGVIGLTKHMAWDLGPQGIRVNAVCPGATLTPLVESMTDKIDRERTAEKIPLRRWARPEDQANAVAYLASEQAAYVTGTVLEIDGGKQLGIRHEV